MGGSAKAEKESREGGGQENDPGRGVGGSKTLRKAGLLGNSPGAPHMGT